MEEKRMDGKEIARWLRGCATLHGKCPKSCPCMDVRGRGDCVRKLMIIAAEHLEQEERDDGKREEKN